jgi:hypothetical protein
MGDKIKTIKIVLNKGNGLFDYSSQFYKKYKEVYKEECNYNNNKDFKFRTDSKIIKIFELLGNRKSSGFISDLKIEYIPEELLSYCKITTVKGYESVRINYAKIYSDILFEIVNNSSISEEYKKKINQIKYIEENFSKRNSHLFDFVN